MLRCLIAHPLYQTTKSYIVYFVVANSLKPLLVFQLFLYHQFNALKYIVIFFVFQTQLENGTYEEHSVDQDSSAVFTSYNGIFRIEASDDFLNDDGCNVSMSYEFLLPESYTCVGKLSLCSTKYNDSSRKPFYGKVIWLK